MNKVIGKVSSKFVEGLKAYLLTNKESNMVYMESTNSMYREVDADVRKDKIVCTYIEKQKDIMNTKVYRFELTEDMFNDAIADGYGDKADIFFMHTDNMSVNFVLREIDILLNSTDIEDKYIYGTCVYMCGLYTSDKTNMIKVS